MFRNKQKVLQFLLLQLFGMVLISATSIFNWQFWVLWLVIIVFGLSNYFEGRVYV